MPFLKDLESGGPIVRLGVAIATADYCPIFYFFLHTLVFSLFRRASSSLDSVHSSLSPHLSSPPVRLSSSHSLSLSLDRAGAGAAGSVSSLSRCQFHRPPPAVPASF